jgi:hypothetical protein
VIANPIHKALHGGRRNDSKDFAGHHAEKRTSDDLPEGLVKGKKVYLAIASGGVYSEGLPNLKENALRRAIESIKV